MHFQTATRVTKIEYKGCEDPFRDLGVPMSSRKVRVRSRATFLVAALALAAGVQFVTVRPAAAASLPHTSRSHYIYATNMAGMNNWVVNQSSSMWLLGQTDGAKVANQPADFYGILQFGQPTRNPSLSSYSGYGGNLNDAGAPFYGMLQTEPPHSITLRDGSHRQA